MNDLQEVLFRKAFEAFETLQRERYIDFKKKYNEI